MKPLSLRELQSEAQRHLDRSVYDFFAGGADDEVTLQANEAAFGGIGLVPRVLRKSGKCPLEVSLLGCRASMPVLIAPTAFHRLAHPDGECATARASAAAGTIMIAAMASTMSIQDVAAAAAGVAGGAERNLWFQLYIQPDLGFTEAIVPRVAAAGCSALVGTVDSPRLVRRTRYLLNGFHDLPPGTCCGTLREPPTAGGRGRPP